jgi:competence protein ComEC
MSVFFLRVVFLGIIFSLGALTFVQTSSGSKQTQYLSVRFLDVGQGDAIHIQTPDGYELLIDGGATSLVLRELASGRSFFDSTIDVVLATHPDSDHIGGLVDVLARYQVATIIQTNTLNDTPAAAAYADSVTNERAQVVLAQTGQIIQLGASTTVRVLSPTGDTTRWRSNAASIIVQVSYGKIDFLLTGDAPLETEAYITQIFGESLQSEVLKLGHHGSKTSSSGAFLDVVQPDFAVVSAERNGRYGHPHAEVVGRVVERKIQLLSTAEEGTIEFLTDGKSVWQNK